ncbi:beta-ketoacyl-ACP synthase II [Thermosulfurimonas dismutans]|uniref:3-oxoacyl-[acyl-carrier-protein] synthase 2 n=1 Tax=Thermosulfurimonas dismutans TaxID=999894 RepID=A0A179D6I8_9BACT|nr:beta-ketoacyl-ACP synthase II [Thermosulfurimonas dismutans]OAQ21657.1 3-oxoacyl-[acyl-carrier-protein] synthase, KASII [Thermosulfurimonas dismutans]
MRRRVVVTGLGAVSPLGIGVEETWKRAVAGESGIGPITKFDASELPSRIAGEVKGFKPEEFMPRKLVSRIDTFIQYAIAAARMALEDAGLPTSDLGPSAGAIIGVGMGGMGVVENYSLVVREKGYRRITPFFIPMVIPNMAAGQVAILFGAKGPNTAVCTACAAGNHAIGEAFRLIREGLAEVMICGGTESLITPLSVGGFAIMKALSTRNDEPQRASRPFDAKRDGFVIAEGCGILVLESLEHAKARGAKIYAEIVGYGLNADAYHMTAPHPEGEGAARCMEMALSDAGLKPQDVDYINAHGTSTPLNDAAETKAIKKVFGDHAHRLAISSTKSMTGHLLGGAGGLEAVFTVKTVYEDIIPPTVNYEEPDPECDLDYVPNEARRTEVRVAMSNAFGFGGTNAVLVFKKFEE